MLLNRIRLGRNIDGHFIRKDERSRRVAIELQRKKKFRLASILIYVYILKESFLGIVTIQALQSQHNHRPSKSSSFIRKQVSKKKKNNKPRSFNTLNKKCLQIFNKYIKTRTNSENCNSNLMCHYNNAFRTKI